MNSIKNNGLERNRPVLKLLLITLLLTSCGSDDQICENYNWEVNICPEGKPDQPPIYQPAIDTRNNTPIDRTPTRPNGGNKRYSPYGSYTNENSF